MSNRINQKDLENQVRVINEITNQSQEQWNSETHKSNIGNYHLSWAYGGVTLHQMVNDGGGVTTPLGGGYFTKRELYEKMHAFIAGLTYKR